MTEEKREEVTMEVDGTSPTLTLRDMIRSSREFIFNTVQTARAHSPLAEDKLEVADEAIADAIHSGYQAVKRVVVNGHPAVILTVAGVAAAVPSFPFGARTLLRNSGLAITLASVMIYPDHLRGSFTSTPSSQDSSSSTP